MGLLWSYCLALSAQVTESSALGHREVHQSSQNCGDQRTCDSAITMPYKLQACKDAAISVLYLNLQSLKGLDA
ncbi:hypothetical protein Q3G72_026393 [Acer saccharum]|nr:hypothetical protein Q3G72_026393 [Acer saccharum]